MALPAQAAGVATPRRTRTLLAVIIVGSGRDRISHGARVGGWGWGALGRLKGQRRGGGGHDTKTTGWGLEEGRQQRRRAGFSHAQRRKGGLANSRVHASLPIPIIKFLFSVTFPYLHVVVVDEEDYLKVAGQDVANHVDRPALEGLRQDSVVGVGAAFLSDLESLKGEKEASSLYTSEREKYPTSS